MKILFYMLMIFVSMKTNAQTAHYVDILKGGYHFTAVQYAAFDQPEAAEGKAPKEYLQEILKDTDTKIQENYVLVKEVDFKDDLPAMVASQSPSDQDEKVESNFWNISLLKDCAEKNIVQIKRVLFHRSLGHKELEAESLAVLHLENGLIQGRPVGSVCGKYKGAYGEDRVGDLVAEFKVLSFITKQSEVSLVKLFKLNHLMLEGRDPFKLQLLKYLKTKILVESYKGTNTETLDLKSVFQSFKQRYYSKTSSVLADGFSIEFDLNEIHKKLDILFNEVTSELH